FLMILKSDFDYQILGEPQIKPIEIDHIPNIVQQPRSASAKRRIDLSLFACSSF
ncbi:hypothetical protein Droror1_Dr00008219, partial [Drosera rotundifolia]